MRLPQPLVIEQEPQAAHGVIVADPGQSFRQRSALNRSRPLHARRRDHPRRALRLRLPQRLQVSRRRHWRLDGACAVRATLPICPWLVDATPVVPRRWRSRPGLRAALTPPGVISPTGAMSYDTVPCPSMDGIAVRGEELEPTLATRLMMMMIIVV